MTHPGIGRHEGSPAERDALILTEPIRQARPGPVLSAPDQAGTECAAFHRATDAQEPIRRGNGLEFEPVLVDGRLAQRRPHEPDADRMGSRYPLDQSREHPGSRRTGHEIPVVVPHAIRLHGDGKALQSLAQNLQKIAIVLRSEEQRHAAVAAMNDVKVSVWIEAMVVTRHGCDPVRSKASAGIPGSLSR